MGKKLVQANPYLRDPMTRRRAILRSVATSSAIEGIRAPFRNQPAADQASEHALADEIKHGNSRATAGESTRSPRGKAKRR